MNEKTTEEKIAEIVLANPKLKLLIKEALSEQEKMDDLEAMLIEIEKVVLLMDEETEKTAETEEEKTRKDIEEIAKLGLLLFCPHRNPYTGKSHSWAEVLTKSILGK